MCLNWKVLAGLGAVAAGVYLVAPQTFAVALPFLFILACPLSMLFMMRGMNRGQSCSAERNGAGADASAATTTARWAVDDLEVARLRAEVDQLRAEVRARRSATGIEPGGRHERPVPPATRRSGS